MASNSSIVGSIGVYMMIIIIYGGLLEKLGIRVYIFKSGSSKTSAHRLESRRGLRGGLWKRLSARYPPWFKKRVLMHRGSMITNRSELFSGRTLHSG